MTIPASFLDEVRARASLSTVVQRSTPLKKAGREWKACCPFHQENSPSFTVNDEKGFYHCFGCGAHGDVIRWMMEQNGMQFLDVVKELAAAAGMEVPAPDPQAAERAQRRDATVDINARAQRFFAGQLQADNDAKIYLAGRGISDGLIERFNIGFAPNSRPGQLSPLMAALEGVDSADLEKLGLVKRNPDTGAAYDFFRRRIIIPIHDARGGVIGFGGRILGDGEPKYLNSPDTPVFDKGRALFNLHRAAPAARAKGRLLIVEGYMDVIGLDAVGFDAAVAPNGTALTEHQLFLAWKIVDVPTVCFDGDNAGRKAAARAAYRALPVMEPGKSLRFAFPPDGSDPDDLARTGGLEAVNAMVEAGEALVDVIWRDLLARFDVRNPDQRAALATEIKRVLASARNPDVRSAYADTLRQLFQAAGARQAAAPGHHQARGRGRNVNIAVESALILGIIDNPSVLDVHGASISGLRWRSDDHKHLATVLASAVDAQDDGGNALDRETVLAAVERAGMTEFVALMRREALQMPFSAETDPQRAALLVLDALRANFT